jgi:transcription initiation factor TFIIH subunit 2
MAAGFRKTAQDVGDDPEETEGYRWEGGYEKTWEVITEDADGLLEPSVNDIIQREKRKRILERNKNRVRLGMMRYFFVVVDLSESMDDTDLKTTRHLCSLKLLEVMIKIVGESDALVLLLSPVSVNLLDTEIQRWKTAKTFKH